MNICNSWYLRRFVEQLPNVRLLTGILKRTKICRVIHLVKVSQ